MTWTIEEFTPFGVCCLCGNSGMVDTRGRVFSGWGNPCGAKVCCLCPNGRAVKAGLADMVTKVSRHLEPHLKFGLDPLGYAMRLVYEADLSGDMVHLELPGQHAANGKPVTFDLARKVWWPEE